MKNLKMYVYKRVWRAKIDKCPCEVCGSTKNVVKHHEDYAKALDIVQLCAKCHIKRHEYNKEFINNDKTKEVFASHGFNIVEKVKKEVEADSTKSQFYNSGDTAGGRPRWRMPQFVKASVMRKIKTEDRMMKLKARADKEKRKKEKRKRGRPFELDGAVMEEFYLLPTQLKALEDDAKQQGVSRSRVLRGILDEHYKLGVKHELGNNQR